MAGKQRGSIPTAFQARRAIAQRKYSRSAKGKAASRKYGKSAKGKATHFRYNHSQKGKEGRERWAKGPGREKLLAIYRRYYYRHIPEARAIKRTPEQIAIKKRWARATRAGLPSSVKSIQEWLDKGLLDPTMVAWLTRD